MHIGQASIVERCSLFRRTQAEVALSWTLEEEGGGGGGGGGGGRNSLSQALPEPGSPSTKK